MKGPQAGEVRGSCVCGAVCYEATGPFAQMWNCHCPVCRKHHGAAFATYVFGALANFRFVAGEDRLLTYRSSDGSLRASCRTCGSPVPEVHVDRDLVLLPAGPLEGDLGLKPQAHLFVGSKAPWYDITDALPQHAEYPAGYAMAGVIQARVEPRQGLTQGSCLCGAAAYEAEGPALFMNNCHCSRCRRARGAAHGTNIFYRLGQFRWIRGGELRSEFKHPEARVLTTSFCRQCGGALPRVIGQAGIASIPAGGLDTEPPMRPERHCFTNYRAPWFEIADRLPQYADAPPPLPR